MDSLRRAIRTLYDLGLVRRCLLHFCKSHGSEGDVSLTRTCANLELGKDA